MIKTIKDKIIEIINADTAYTAQGTFPSGKIPTSSLPFIVVSPGRARRQRLDSLRTEVVREYYLDFFLTVVSNADRKYVNGVYDDSLAVYIETLIDVFDDDRLLSRLSKVKDAFIRADDYIGVSGWDNTTYAGTRLILEVTYTQYRS